MTRTGDRIRVLMVGPSPEVRGGVSQVIRLMLSHAPPQVEYQVIATLTPKTVVPGHWGTSFRQIVPIFRNVVHFTRSAAQIRRVVRSGTIDLVHIHFASWGSSIRKYFVSRIVQRAGKPYVMHAHGGSFEEFYKSIPKFLKKEIRSMLSNSSGLVTLSEYWKKFYQKILEPKTPPLYVMHNPIVLPDTVPARDHSRLYLVYLGRMNEWKGSERALQALAVLPESLRSCVRLRMAGDGEVSRMRQVAEALRIQHIVDIREWIEGEEKQHWLASSGAFILPSRAEGLPMSLLEAMAWGMPAIVTPVGSIPEFVEDGSEGFLVPPDDIQAISRAIAILAENPELRAQMGRAARQRVEELDISRYMQKMYAIYQQCLSAHTEAFE